MSLRLRIASWINCGNCMQLFRCRYWCILLYCNCFDFEQYYQWFPANATVWSKRGCVHVFTWRLKWPWHVRQQLPWNLKLPSSRKIDKRKTVAQYVNVGWMHICVCTLYPSCHTGNLLKSTLLWFFHVQKQSNKTLRAKSQSSPFCDLPAMANERKIRFIESCSFLRSASLNHVAGSDAKREFLEASAGMVSSLQQLLSRAVGTMWTPTIMWISGWNQHLNISAHILTKSCWALPHLYVQKKKKKTSWGRCPGKEGFRSGRFERALWYEARVCIWAKFMYCCASSQYWGIRIRERGNKENGPIWH